MTLLCVTPDGARPDWLIVPEPPAASPRPESRLEGTAEPRGDVPVNVLVRPGRDAGAAILATVRADPPDLLLLCWRGSPGRGRYLLGSTLDPVIRYAPCDVTVARANDGPRRICKSWATCGGYWCQRPAASTPRWHWNWRCTFRPTSRSRRYTSPVTCWARPRSRWGTSG